MIETRTHLRLRQMRSHHDRAVDQVGVATLTGSPKPQTGKIKEKKGPLASEPKRLYKFITTPAPHEFNVVLRCKTHASQL